MNELIGFDIIVFTIVVAIVFLFDYEFSFKWKIKIALGCIIFIIMCELGSIIGMGGIY